MMNPTLSAEAVAMLGAVDSLRATVAMARALAQSGREIDLTGLDREAERLCAAVACVGAALRPLLLEPLAAVVIEVDRLATVMREA